MRLTEEQKKLLEVLEHRFNKNHLRHPALYWDDVAASILHDEKYLQALLWMEETGGEPDVIGFEEESKSYLIADCSKESPLRRSLCYDRAAWEKRKHNKPLSSAWEQAQQYGVKLMNEQEYMLLQSRGSVDDKSSSWLDTPPEMRASGGALFGDARYGRVFVYHNGAESYYASRGFRVILRVK